jgi:hypothetical protein
VPASRSMTILLGANDKIEWYMGETGKSTPTTDNFGKDGLRKALVDNYNKVKKESGGKEMIVLVKPSDHSNYNDLVATLDEMNIANIQIHAIVDITPPEVELLKRDHNY